MNINKIEAKIFQNILKRIAGVLLDVGKDEKEDGDDNGKIVDYDNGIKKQEKEKAGKFSEPNIEIKYLRPKNTDKEILRIL